MSIALKILPLFFPTAMALWVSVFPSPDAAVEVLNWSAKEDARANIIYAGFDRDVTKIADPDAVLTFGDFDRLDCVEKLSGASTEDLRTCSQIVASAILQVARYEQATGVETTTAERLLLAATEVCRAAWTMSPGLQVDLNDPACASSTLRMASLH